MYAEMFPALSALLVPIGAAIFRFRKSGIGNYGRMWTIQTGRGYVEGKRQEKNNWIYMAVPTGGSIGMELGTGETYVAHDMREDQELVVDNVDREHTRTILGTRRFVTDGIHRLDENTEVRFMGGVGNETFNRRFPYQLFRDGLV